MIPAVTPTATAAQSEPSTRAESTAYMETSRYDDVVEFIDTIVPQSEWLHLGSMGYTHEGRRIPLVVAGNVATGTGVVGEVELVPG